MAKHFVYVLQSEADPQQYYVGMAEDVESRLKAHNNGQSPHTSKFKPWRIVFSSWFDEPTKAAAFERYLKSGSGRAFATRHIR
jgi:predicted GIY-YIG superfamily endonuclease